MHQSLDVKASANFNLSVGMRIVGLSPYNVALILLMSSPDTRRKIVVLPALSSPLCLRQQGEQLGRAVVTVHLTT